MSDSESFLSRWARRKREAAGKAEVETPPQDTRAPAPVDSEPLVDSAKSPSARSEGAKSESAKGRRDDNPHGASAEPAFDPESLPPIESITAGTDIRAYLAPGVPAELTRAALRRAWVADPSIRDFVGLSENSWDFNAPGGVPGFGPLDLTDELRQAVARLMTPTSDEAARQVPEETSAQRNSIQTGSDSDQTPQEDLRDQALHTQDEPENEDEDSRATEEIVVAEKDHVAMQQSAQRIQDRQPLAKMRSRGRALPK